MKCLSWARLVACAALVAGSAPLFVVAPATSGNKFDGSEPGIEAAAEITVPIAGLCAPTLKLSVPPGADWIAAVVVIMFVAASTTLPTLSVTEKTWPECVVVSKLAVNSL